VIWASFDSEAEGHFVAAFLNSDHAAEVIEGWMNLGLFGPRDINKRILDVRWPRFDPETPDHQSLSVSAAGLSREAKSLLKALPKAKAGTQRRWMRDHLPGAELQIVERLVKRLSGKP